MKRLKESWLSKLFYNDMVVKILSVVVAVIGWFLVAMIVDPEAEATIYNIPVRVAVEGSSLQNLGLNVVGGENQTVNVRVKGKRYQIGTLTPDDFNAVAYPTSVTAPGEYQLEVFVQKADTTKEFEVLSGSLEQITVRFDRIATKTFDLAAEVGGLNLASGYIRSDPVATASPKQITITGPEQNVNRVGKCVVRAEVSEELSKTLSVNGTLEILDADGQPLEPEENKFILSSEKFAVTIPVLKQKMLPLTFDYLNVPAGFSTDQLVCRMSSESIQVAAPVEVIDNMTELKVGYVDFKQLDLNYTKEFEIELPTGFINSTNLTKITVSFDTSGFTSKNTWISKDNLKIVNVPDGYRAKVVTRAINSVRIIGSEENLVGISYQDVVGEIDMMNTSVAEEGQYTVPVTVKFPSKSGVWAVGEYTAVVSVQSE
ncbi:MAG: hypothetical protein HFJ85_04160 [Oscillospiraceae bacterium]|nr:hypothetical protein [Oscillospiraceae bacterium]